MAARSLNSCGPVNDAAYDAGKWLATAHSDGTVRIWSSGELVAELVGHKASVLCLSWAPVTSGPSTLASGASDGQVVLWREVRPGEWQNVYQKFVTGAVKALAFSDPEPQLILAIGGGDELGVLTFLVELRRGAQGGDQWQVKAIPAHGGGVLSLSWAPASSPLVLATGPAVARGQTQGRALAPVRRLATAGRDGRLLTWRVDARGQNPLQEIVLDDGNGGGVAALASGGLWTAVAWRPNCGLPSQTLVACSEDGQVSVLVQDAEGLPFGPRQSFNLGAVSPERIAWTKAGTLLAVALADSSVLFKESTGGKWTKVTTVGE
ncbi:Sec13 [Symbiodinium sp. CCMP2592]|nr:Sec13 [Symbiodinium sp. CCMP2592]